MTIIDHLLAVPPAVAETVELRVRKAGFIVMRRWTSENGTLAPGAVVFSIIRLAKADDDLSPNGLETAGRTGIDRMFGPGAYIGSRINDGPLTAKA